MLKNLINKLIKRKRQVSPLDQFGDTDLRVYTAKEQRLEHNPLLYWVATLIDENSHLIGIARSLFATDIPDMIGQKSKGLDIFVSARQQNAGMSVAAFRAGWITVKNGNIEFYFSEYYYRQAGNNHTVFSISAADPDADIQLLKLLLEIRLGYTKPHDSVNTNCFPFTGLPEKPICYSKTA